MEKITPRQGIPFADPARGEGDPACVGRRRRGIGRRTGDDACAAEICGNEGISYPGGRAGGRDQRILEQWGREQ